MIGSGSNIVWKDEGFTGLLIVNNILHYEVYKEDESTFYATVGSGEPWDSVVQRTVESGLTGIECLSLIPGKAGATPIQNVGAYGQEIAETLTTIEAYDSSIDDFVMIPMSECAFGYRTSRFKTTDKGRFFITAITLHLIKGNPMPPFYASLATYLEANKITKYTPEVIRNAVINIRNSKLPDPARFSNTGSFFGNPIISDTQLIDLIDQFPDLPHWSAEKGYTKLSAAWLIEQAGFKGMHDKETGMVSWPTQPLVLVNEAAKSTSDLLAFKQKIVDEVNNKFGVTLEQEPELLP
jgi:UDP-N-acetylmuramate dehydrogenase